MSILPKTFAVILAGIASGPLVAQSVQDVSHDDVEMRYRSGQDAAREGKDDEALKEFIWCYDVGMTRVASYAGVRTSFLLGDWAQLARHYQPAREELEKRRDAALAKISADPADTSDAQDFAGINHSLGEDKKTLAYYEKLPIDSQQRGMMGYEVFDLLLEGQRYKDAARAMPFNEFEELFAETTKPSPGSPQDSVGPRKRYETQSGAREIEALAGAGQIKEAKKMIAMVLRYDSSAEGKDVIQEHLKRAGHPELLP